MDEKTAKTKAKKLCKRMKGKGWEARWWQGCGWWYGVHNGFLAVNAVHSRPPRRP